MISRAISVIVLATCALAINSAAALAAPGDEKGSDPTKVGENAKGMVEPNAKAFWWIALILGLLGMAFTKKNSRAGGIAIALLVSGVAIYNPAGVGSFMQGVATRVI